MSRGPWNHRPLVPQVPSADISETGLLSIVQIVGSRRLGIKPIFDIPKVQLLREVDSFNFPPPVRIAPAFAWRSGDVKAFVTLLEATREPESGDQKIPAGYIRVSDFPVSKQSVYAWLASGKLPPPERFGRLVAWPRATVEALLTPSTVSRPRVKHRALVPASEIVPDKIVNNVQVQAMFGWDRETLEAAIEHEGFPKPVRCDNVPFGQGPLMWGSKVIRAYVEQLEQGAL
jgi:predicted DNA-binding transcriptional regulator AlpA